MDNLLTNVVFLGGIETGKTSTIQQLWEDYIEDYHCEEGIHHFKVSEELIGRECVNFRVSELPRINYTSNSWIDKPHIKDTLENADVIVYVITFDELSVSSRSKYIQDLFKKIHLKKNVSIVVAYGMADWVLFPSAARELQTVDTNRVNKSYITTLLNKIALLYLEFEYLKQYDLSFNIDSIISYSNTLNWNLNELKYRIWNGIVLSANTKSYDENLPTVVFSGKTGCGKTSTINALWHKNLDVDRAVSCTKFPAVMRIKEEYQGKEIEFNLVDLPGIAESMEANTLYKKFYEKYIAKANVLICLSQADRRAYKQDQLFYSGLIADGVLHPKQNIILGINQADLLFKSKENPNGIDLNTVKADDIIIIEKTQDYYDCVFKDVFKDFESVTQESVIIYSVYQKWNLEKLKQFIYKYF